MEVNFTLVQQKATPLRQLFASIIIGLAGMGLGRLLHLQPGYEYFAALIAIIFYTIMNTVVSIAYGSFFKYTVPSYYSYIALVVVLFLSSKFLSGISIWDLWEYRMMITSITIFYFIISTLVRAIRFMFELAEGEDL